MLWRNLLRLRGVGTKCGRLNSVSITSALQLHTTMANNKSLQNKAGQRLVWVDCEMTGLDPDQDSLLEVAVLVTERDLSLVAEGPNLVIHQPDAVLEAMGHWCTMTHGMSGLTEAVKASKVSLKEAEDAVLEFLREHTPEGKCPLAGNSIGQDAKFLCKHMPRLMDHLHYRVVDVSTVKELARRWRPSLLGGAPPKKLGHRAMDDIKESLKELEFYRDNFFVIGGADEVAGEADPPEGEDKGQK